MPRAPNIMLQRSGVRRLVSAMNPGWGSRGFHELLGSRTFALWVRQLPRHPRPLPVPLTSTMFRALVLFTPNQ